MAKFTRQKTCNNFPLYGVYLNFVGMYMTVLIEYNKLSLS